ncbi:MAG: Na+/proline symporter [Candidatus Midichloria mitochondrii]|nr:sodium:solute symporter family protein [Candidatus Midichloria mitochondrii]MDJ1299118.1 sodium:solute symporter family protein [Candidatus Midichloria mitochondrii]
MHNIHIIDIAIIILYFVVCIAVGLYKYKSVTTLKEYTLGGRNFPNLVIVTTLFSTEIGSASTMGLAEKIYTLGVFFLVPILVMPIAIWSITALVYGKNIDQFTGCISVSDIMNKLYGKVGRWVTNIAAVPMSIMVVTMQSTALGYLCHYFFSIPVSSSVILSTLILALYSAFGGIRAVAYTDVFQFCVLMLAIPSACFIVYGMESGGGIMHWHRVWDQLPQDMLEFNIDRNNIALFLSLILFSCIPQTEGTFIQRFLLTRNSKQLMQCIKAVIPLNIFFIISVCLIGFLVKAKAPDIDPNTAFVYFIANYLIIGIKGLVIAGLLAVIMSTADSWLNTTSVLITHDIIRKLISLNDRQSLAVARCSTFTMAVLAIILSIYEIGILELEWIGGNFWMPIIVIPLSAGFLKFRTNSKSFVASVVLAITFTCVSGYIVGDFATISLICGMIGSAVGLFGMHHWQKGQGMDPAAKHKAQAAIEEKEQSKIGYANSAEQIEEWYQESSDRNKKIEALLDNLSKDRC